MKLGLLAGMDNTMSMAVLDKKVPAEPILLFIAGAIMVLTLWFSKKAKTVAETEISLSRQGELMKNLNQIRLSRVVVKGSTGLSIILYVYSTVNTIKLAKVLKSQNLQLQKDQSIEAPAFDMIRASVNLMVAGVLIAIATSMKLPLIYHLCNFYGSHGYISSRSSLGKRKCSLQSCWSIKCNWWMVWYCIRSISCRWYCSTFN